MKTIYFISGLGADERMFEQLTLPPGISVVYLSWLPPLPGETIDAYAQRMSAGIDTSQPFYLAGLSFGGMVATEMLRYVQPEKTILISSAACRYELPALYRFAGALGLHRLLTVKLAANASLIVSYLFQLKTPAQRKMVQQMMRTTNPQLFQWSVHSIVKWQRREAPDNIIRIHGTADRTLPPVKNRNYQYLVKNGSHFMIASKAQEVSALLAQILNA
ncbi:MAG: alpha/beta hydrolase [Lacibacter sp.]